MPDRRRVSASGLANIGAHVIQEAHLDYRTQFDAITKRATHHFSNRRWHELRADADLRLDLYSQEVGRAVDRLERMLKPRAGERIVWAALKAVYSGLHMGRPDRDIAETFFNSVTRRVFSNVGVDPDIEFVHGDSDFPAAASESIIVRHDGEIADQIEHILRRMPFADQLTDIAGDASLVAHRVQQHTGVAEVTIDTIRNPFFREQGAYVVGRIAVPGQSTVPLVLCIRNSAKGAYVDAVLMERADVSILFSFTRSHFMIDAGPPTEIVGFLRTVMPDKRVAELYVSIGEFKHGKTEFFRDLLDHIETSDSSFETAPGVPGLVMLVFALADYDMVVKVIRDRFSPPKQTTPGQVKDRYRFVFHNDRAGRLVEAHEFEHLRIPVDRFEPDLLATLLDVAAATVEVRGEHVILEHAYLERRVLPLDVYLASHDTDVGAIAVRDYARAIEELAYTDIFCGDILPKNFGLTRNGRVVFYDYDELDLVSAQRFRPVPAPRDFDDEMAEQPWYGIGPRDVFPSEWLGFLGLRGAHRRVLEDEFGRLFDHTFWTQIQERIGGGEAVEVVPYAEHHSLIRDAAQQPQTSPAAGVRLDRIGSPEAAILRDVSDHRMITNVQGSAGTSEQREGRMPSESLVAPDRRGHDGTPGHPSGGTSSGS